MVTLESHVVVSSQQVSVDLTGEAVVLHTGSGVYFGMDEVAQRIWQAIQAPVSVADVLDSLTDEYDVPLDQIREDLLSFLTELESAGLINVESDSTDT